MLVDIVVDGADWSCGLEFDYANEESFYCRPLRREGGERMPVPEAAKRVRVAYLPPMSGLAVNETRLDAGAINVRLGEGRTAEVLRNLCHRILEGEDGDAKWGQLSERVHALFGSRLDAPEYIAERGEIRMTYRTREGVRLDLSASGRGQQQTMLLLAHMTANPGSVLLLDEPDAHLEILRQRQIYQLLSETADETGSQIVAASHSEVVLNEAAGRDVLIAFVGKPHRIDNRGSQVAKALKEIGFEHYLQAEEKGWVLYLEGSTDLAILLALARLLDHPAAKLLEAPYVHYVANQPSRALAHFYGVREAKPDLAGVAIHDRLETPPRAAARRWANDVESLWMSNSRKTTPPQDSGSSSKPTRAASRAKTTLGKAPHSGQHTVGNLPIASEYTPAPSRSGSTSNLLRISRPEEEMRKCAAIPKRFTRKWVTNSWERTSKRTDRTAKA